MSKITDLAPNSVRSTATGGLRTPKKMNLVPNSGRNKKNSGLKIQKKMSLVLYDRTISFSQS